MYLSIYKYIQKRLLSLERNAQQFEKYKNRVKYLNEYTVLSNIANLKISPNTVISVI